MKLKKAYNVMGQWYKVVLVDTKGMRAGRVKKSNVQLLANGSLGECEFPTRVIRLNKELIDGKLLEYTLRHELRHAYQFEMGWPQIMGAQLLEIDCESFVSFVGSMKEQGAL
jgi:hypothetical protein